MQNTPTWCDRHFYLLLTTYAVLALCGYGALGLLVGASKPDCAITPSGGARSTNLEGTSFLYTNVQPGLP